MLQGLKLHTHGLILALMLGLAGPSRAIAEDGAPSGEASFTDAIGLQGGLSWGIGSMGNNSGVTLGIQNRTVNALAFKGFVNYDLRTFFESLPFRLGAGLFPEFRFVGQNTDPTKVLNTNIRGFGMLWGLAFGAEFDEERISAILSFDLFGRHWLTNVTPSFQASVLSKMLGFRMLVGYKVTPKVSADISIQRATYSGSNIVPDLGGSAISQTSFGVGARYFFK